MEQYRKRTERDRCICQYLTNGTLCGVIHRNPTYHLCKKHRLLVIQQLGLNRPNQPVLHIVAPNQVVAEQLIPHTNEQVLKIPIGAKHMTVTLSFN